MLLVKPLHDGSAAKELCELCGAQYHDDTYTYFAADVNEDATKINHIIGVCACKIKGNDNILTLLRYAPNVEDEEALIIMARTVLNFMYRCKVDRVFADETDIVPSLAEKLGFTRSVDGRLSLNLVEFYNSPCKFSHN